jgi:hypothetical protein
MVEKNTKNILEERIQKFRSMRRAQASPTGVQKVQNFERDEFLATDKNNFRCLSSDRVTIRTSKLF